jgi:hypothetical protein
MVGGNTHIVEISYDHCGISINKISLLLSSALVSAHLW